MALAAAISNYLSHRREESRNSGRTVCSAPLPYSEETVKKTVAENPVVVYSKTWCTYCSEVKSLFKKLSVKPLVVELDKLGIRYEVKRCKCKKKMDLKVSESKDNPNKLYYKCWDCDKFAWPNPTIPDDVVERLQARLAGEDKNRELVKKLEGVVNCLSLIVICLVLLVVVIFVKM